MAPNLTPPDPSKIQIPQSKIVLEDPFDPPAPPAVENPQPGDMVPIGNPCPVCGTLRDSWIYHPFLKASQKHHGWVIHRARICACPESDPFARPAHDTPPRPLGLDQEWLDTEFRQRLVRAQTFVTF